MLPEPTGKKQRIRICKDFPDNEFDKPFQALLDEGIIQKIPTKKSVYAFYGLTEKGKTILVF